MAADIASLMLKRGPKLASFTAVLLFVFLLSALAHALPPAANEYKVPLARVTVNLNRETSGPALKLIGMPSVPVEPPQQQVYYYFNVTKINFTDLDVENATIEFRVTSAWMLRNNVSEVFLLMYGNGWNRLMTERVNATEEYSTYRAYTDSFSYFAIVGDVPYVPTPPDVDFSQIDAAARAEAEIAAVQKELDSFRDYLRSTAPRTGRAKALLGDANAKADEAQKALDGKDPARARQLLNVARSLGEYAASARPDEVTGKPVIFAVLLLLMALAVAGYEYEQNVSGKAADAVG